MRIDVLLTDGNYKHTYSALRYLNKKNIKTGILFPSIFNSPAYFSRFVKKRFLLKKTSDEKYMKHIKKMVLENNIDVLLPIGLKNCSFFSKHKKDLSEKVNLPVVDYESMKIAEDKKLTLKFAEEIGIPIPKTYYMEENKIEEIIKKMVFPCVIKGGNIKSVGYCNNKKDLIEKYNFAKKNNNKKMVVIQEYIKGPGTGFYALFNEGKCKAYFMHKRIHEYPITGGASTLAKSVYEDDLKELGIKTLRKLNWHGVAMVEFKRERETGKLKLIEINPKFWGSLELSLRCGVNFPYLDYLMAKGEKIPKFQGYKKNVYFRWTLPYDIMWLRQSSKDEKEKFENWRKKKKIHQNIYYDDPFVNVHNMFHLLYKIKKDERLPHGKIKK